AALFELERFERLASREPVRRREAIGLARGRRGPIEDRARGEHLRDGVEDRVAPESQPGGAELQDRLGPVDVDGAAGQTVAFAVYDAEARRAGGRQSDPCASG